MMDNATTAEERDGRQLPKRPNGCRSTVVAAAPTTRTLAPRPLFLLLLALSTSAAVATPAEKSWPRAESLVASSSASASASVAVISRRSANDGDGGGDATATAEAAAAAAAAAMLYTKPDECPARDEAAAANAGRTCQRKCETDTDCLNDRKLCLCDGVHCGMSCIRPEKECQELPDPPHGQVHLTGRQGRQTMNSCGPECNEMK